MVLYSQFIVINIINELPAAEIADNDQVDRNKENGHLPQTVNQQT
jgi:hypothetical protein